MVQNIVENTIFFFMDAEHRTNCNQIQCVDCTEAAFIGYNNSHDIP